VRDCPFSFVMAELDPANSEIHGSSAWMAIGGGGR
jgi:hypothetical protein